MAANRGVVYSGGLQQACRAGDYASGKGLTTVATDAAVTLDVATMAAGNVRYSGFSAGRNITMDTAVNILAANSWMDIGDSFEVLVSVTPAFAGTFVTAAGVTLAGAATVAASSSRTLLFTRTGAATVTMTAL